MGGGSSEREGEDMAIKAPPFPHGYRCSMTHLHVYNRDGWSPCVQQPAPPLFTSHMHGQEDYF